MARLVYLPSVCSDSWQLWTVRGDGSCLRDYRYNPPAENRGLSTSEIELMLEEPGHFWEMVPEKTYQNYRFWQEQISFKNVSMSLAPIDDVIQGETRHRLQDLFVEEIKEGLSTGQQDRLAMSIRRWLTGFAHVVVERDQFNHWDNTDATGYRGINDGFGWTGRMLEHCRSTQQLDFISTDDPTNDFGLFAAEVCLEAVSKPT